MFHRVLVVEDDPRLAAELCRLLASIGHEAIHVSTLEELRAAIETGGFCCVLLDMEIPADARSRALVSCGETALQLLRKVYPHRRPNGFHVLQILVVTGYSTNHEFVSRIFEMNADGFIAKPFDQKPEVLLDKVRAALVKAGREDHDACEALPLDGAKATPSAAPPRLTGTVTVDIDGSKNKLRNIVRVDSKPCELQDAKFLVFLRLVAARDRAPDAWVAKQDLKIARNPEMPHRLRLAFATTVPAGFLIVEGDKSGRLRLNPAVVVGSVDWKALESHANEAIKKLAKECVARGR
jgi:DNA-binding response OmpR family regulator